MICVDCNKLKHDGDCEMERYDVENEIDRFIKAVPHVDNGDPIKDFIDEMDLFLVARELAIRLELI